MTDNRTPGVSTALARRIGGLLDGGATVSLRRSNLVLRDVALTRADGRETPAAADMRRQVGARGLDPEASTWTDGAEMHQSSKLVTRPSHVTGTMCAT